MKGTLSAYTTRDQNMLYFTRKLPTFEKASVSRALLLEVSEAGIRVLFGSMEITPKYIALAFTMLANIPEFLHEEWRHCIVRTDHWFMFRENTILKLSGITSASS
jgi:hypothetical protein